LKASVVFPRAVHALGAPPQPLRARIQVGLLERRAAARRLQCVRHHSVLDAHV